MISKQARQISRYEELLDQCGDGEQHDGEDNVIGQRHTKRRSGSAKAPQQDISRNGYTVVT